MVFTVSIGTLIDAFANLIIPIVVWRGGSEN